MEQVLPNNKVLYYSTLNILACLAVVFLHVNRCFWEGPKGAAWFSANLIETLFYWAVPVFFMLSGATLMDYRQRMGTREYARRRVVHTVVPYVIWSLIATALVMLRGQAISWQDIVSNLLSPEFMNVYWFFIPLFGIYLSIPVVSAIKSRERLFNYLIAVSLALQSIAPLACTLLGLQYDSAVIPVGASGYIVYVLIGYQLANHELSPKKRTIIYACGVIGWLMQVFGTLAVSSPESGVMRIWKGYTNIPAVMQAIAVFVLVKYADKLIRPKLSDHVSGAVFSLAKVTFGVYLMHFYWVIYFPGWLAIDTHSIIWRLVGPFVIFAISGAITALIRKIPILRLTVGG